MSATRPARHLSVGVIGAGRVGAVLGAALAGAGHTLTAVTGTSRPDRLRTLLPGVTVLPAAEIVRTGPDLLLVAVPDDRLAGVVTGLAQVDVDRPAGRVVAHTSGAHGLAVLGPLTARGYRPLALHPVMTFAGDPSDLPRLTGAGYGVTAPDDLRAFATRLVADLAGVVEWVPEPARPLYHAALSHGANHLVTLVAEAADQLAAAGVRRPARLLGPLLTAALERSLGHGDDALTGPVARGDAGTVGAHLRALTGSEPAAAELYRVLARRTAHRAVRDGRLAPAAAGPLLTLLDDPPAGPDGRRESAGQPVPAGHATGADR